MHTGATSSIKMICPDSVCVKSFRVQGQLTIMILVGTICIWLAKRRKEMLVLPKQAFVGREEIRLPYKSLRGRLPESTVLTCSSKTGQFCFVNWWFHFIIFKIIETHLEYKHSEHRTAFRAWKVIGTFEKWTLGRKVPETADGVDVGAD